MKKIHTILSLILMTVLIQGCHKREELSFIHNMSGHTVTINYQYQSEPRSVTLDPGQTKEIPDIEQWSLTRTPQGDTVYFVYADTTIIHTCEQVLYSDGTGELLFHPSDNNILLDEPGHTSWEISDPDRRNEIHKTYTVRR